MIPKVIHYCWFGGKPLDEMGRNCKKSWEKFFPDYEIIEWNESNFDVNCCDYIKEAYQCKKWAFVSDYARFKILYEHGGLYFDTDVEVIRDFSEILKTGAFMGAETLKEKENNGIRTKHLEVAAGLGLAAEKGSAFCREVMEHYEKSCFISKETGQQDFTTVVERVTELLIRHGLKHSLEIQKIEGITIFPPEYFNPMDMSTGKIHITENTYSIHHYAGSWCSGTQKIHKILYKMICRIFGNRISGMIRHVYSVLRKGKQADEK